ncbi:ArsB/NhaD family transporter [Bacillus sp. V2I10]|uniref:ArsB/NhaD family transporter n=1 Tax=Bacillus sp. V2I10 TaxID=3042276 RepID=UPI0027820785|nr:ArsB/NhaD family transporter [Bacillus sp. V2I10]MDQ0860565.1 arsenical pump membrane protein [Bacillus sp. V2I10]
MLDFSFILMCVVFSITVILMLWRPFGINETVPTVTGAIIILLAGIVPLSDVAAIYNIISGAAITILSTIVMSIVLESVGFFRWIAYNLVNKSNGSGIKLFINVNLLCFLTTLFFNNDGSILITTPIIIHITSLLQLKRHQKIPYLISGAITATVSSAPIAVSNIANLIALKIVGLDLNSYVNMMFIPSMLGIIVITTLIFFYYRKDIPVKISSQKLYLSGNTSKYPRHPLAMPSSLTSHEVDWKMFRICIAIVIFVRGGFFLLTPIGVPMEGLAIGGAVALILVRWLKSRKGITDIVKRTPWHIFLFAFGMYVLVYGLHNIGLSHYLTMQLKDYVDGSLLGGTLVIGVLLTALSNVLNNLPAVMIGTLAIVDMGLDTHSLQVAYLAIVLGSDVGALLTPIGTLATLIWMFILKSNNIHISWKEYMKLTFFVIPVGLFVSLIALYLWNGFIL